MTFDICPGTRAPKVTLTGQLDRKLSGSKLGQIVASLGQLRGRADSTTGAMFFIVLLSRKWTLSALYATIQKLISLVV